MPRRAPSSSAAKTSGAARPKEASVSRKENTARVANAAPSSRAASVGSVHSGAPIKNRIPPQTTTDANTVKSAPKTTSSAKSGFKVRRSSLSRREAAKQTVRRKGLTPEIDPLQLPEEARFMPSASKEENPLPASSLGVKTEVGVGKSENNRRRRSNDFIKPTDVVRIKGSYDRLFLVLVIVLTLFGIVMDFSASYKYAFVAYNDSFYFVRRQIVYAIIGFIGMFAAMHFDYRWLRKATVPAFIGTLVLLIGVLVYGVASGVAQRWISIGSVTIQPSEIMKFSLVILLALYVARNQDRITNYRNFWQSSTYGVFIPMIIVGLVCVLVALEKHFSGTIILFLIGMMVIFSAGARKGWFLGGGAAAAAIIIPAILFVPYARQRVDMWLHPESYEITGSIWQTVQGLYAVGSGGLFGVGLGNSRQKHLFVSQPQNDFIFAIVAEELGFVGAVVLILLFMLLIWRGFVIALKAPDTFSSLVVIGLISKVAIQTILNIAVVTNLIPNTGISLPFFSYGGTALMMQLGEMGIILSISRYSYQREPT